MKQKAFTLIELLVVIVIITIMTTIVIVNYRPGEQVINLQREGVKFSQNVRKTQAMLGFGWQECKENDEYPEGYKRGYGLFLDENLKDKYYIFADCFGTQEYNENQDKIVETINLEEGIELDINHNISIVFELPDPNVFLIPDEVRFSFKKIGDGSSLEITVNKLGLVEIN